MQIEMITALGTKIIVREKIGGFGYEFLALTEDKKEIAIQLDADDLKGLALLLHRLSVRTI